MSRWSRLLLIATVASCGRAPSSPPSEHARVVAPAASSARAATSASAVPAPETARDRSPVTVFNTTEHLPASMQTTYGPSFFAKRTLIRLEVGVGCSDARARACKSFGWPEYAARCKQGKGIEHAVIELKKLTDVQIWPDGYTPKAGEIAAFSWQVYYDTAFDIPPQIFCKPVVTDTYWFSVPKTTAPIEARSTSYGSDLCLCIE